MARDKRKRDKTSGSRSYNRIDFQVSQGILFSIEFYDVSDYLIALDYYDDLAIIENTDDQSIVSYYQVKTTEDKFTITSILNEEWLVDLYDHLAEENGFDAVGELGLITNCRVENKNHREDEPKYINNVPGKTKLSALRGDTAELIKKDIAEKLGIEVDEIDLSKLVIIQTTLDIHSHEHFARLNFIDFVNGKLGNVGIDVVRAAYESLRDKFDKCQRFELPEFAEQIEVQAKKCISKAVLTESLQTIAEIDFPLIENLLLLVPEENKQGFSVAYANAISDNLRAVDNVITVQKRIKTIVSELNLSEPYMTWANACVIRDKYYERYPQEFFLPYSVNEDYILVLAFVVLSHI